MFNDTITVYNKYRGEDGFEQWQRSVVKGVFWNAIKGAVIRRTGISTADSVQIIIPCAVRVDSRTYKEPKAWEQLPDKMGHWTLKPGDTVIKGSIDYEIVKSSKELQGYDDVLNITSVDFKDFSSDMAHWEVSGK